MIPFEMKHKMEAAAYLRNTQYYIIAVTGKCHMILLCDGVACKAMVTPCLMHNTVGG